MPYKNNYVIIEEKDFEKNSLLGLMYFVFGDKIAPYMGLIK